MMKRMMVRFSSFSFCWLFGVCSAIIQVRILIITDNLVSYIYKVAFFWLCWTQELNFSALDMGIFIIQVMRWIHI